jgi:hypothetical protein
MGYSWGGYNGEGPQRGIFPLSTLRDRWDAREAGHWQPSVSQTALRASGEGTGLFLSGPFNHRGVCEPVGASVFPPGTLVMTPASRGMGRALQAVGELFG